MRDRDVMNLLDQVELYVLRLGDGKVDQKEYWKFIYTTMKSGMLLTRQMERHVLYKLESLGIQHRQ